jgi:hypothetical protein
VYLWMPMVTWGVVRLICALIDWRARITYERTRAASVVKVLRAAPAGVAVRDSHADGAALCIEIAARSRPCRRAAHQMSRRKPC